MVVETSRTRGLIDEIEAAHEDARMMGRVRDELSRALTRLKEAARWVIERRDASDLQDWISDLEDAIPCDDCLHAPCACPDGR